MLKSKWTPRRRALGKLLPLPVNRHCVGESAHAIAGEGADVSGLEGEDDVLLGDAGGGELFGDGAVGAVVLHPDLSVVDVHVDDGAVDAAAAVPADVQDLVVVVVAVDDGLGVDLAIGGAVAGIFADEAGEDFASSRK